jgi:hypothetical protein
LCLTSWMSRFEGVIPVKIPSVMHMDPRVQETMLINHGGHSDQSVIFNMVLYILMQLPILVLRHWMIHAGYSKVKETAFHNLYWLWKWFFAKKFKNNSSDPKDEICDSSDNAWRWVLVIWNSTNLGKVMWNHIWGCLTGYILFKADYQSRYIYGNIL